MKKAALPKQNDQINQPPYSTSKRAIASLIREVLAGISAVLK